MADQTIGKTFKFRVYSRRWGHDDTYSVTRTATGWHVSHMSIEGDCDKKGNHALFASFNQDLISYPQDVGDLMEHLWDDAAQKNLTAEGVQNALQAVADWVSNCERAFPNTPPFDGSK